MKYLETEETICVMVSKSEFGKAMYSKQEFDKFIDKLEEATNCPLRVCYETMVNLEKMLKQ